MCFTLLDNFPRTLMQWLHFEEAPLWTMVTEAASRADYRSLNKNDWRISEAEAFAEVLTERRLSPSVRDTLTFEIAEHRLRRPANDHEVRVKVDAVPLDFQLNQHAVITLSRSPTDYETTKPKPGSAEADHAYLLVPRGMAVRYLEPDKATIELLDKIERAAASGETIAVPARGVTALMAAKVLKLPQPTPATA
jgi:hypothetical protein